jgi:hypothetical protein
MKVFPVAGGRVRDPRTRAVISADGCEVPDNDFYWLRRIAHGDVTTEAPTAAGEETPPATPVEETHQ